MTFIFNLNIFRVELLYYSNLPTETKIDTGIWTEQTPVMSTSLYLNEVLSFVSRSPSNGSVRLFLFCEKKLHVLAEGGGSVIFISPSCNMYAYRHKSTT